MEARTVTDDRVTIAVYPREKQGTGAFDGGRITEVKPIGFPGEGSAAHRIGPLFYWAWATGRGGGKIALHPHRGFEIVSYVLAGEISHRDTLGMRSSVGAGGAQVMQTGSGVSHEEEFHGPQAEIFQIWFEPNLLEAVKRTSTYREANDREFPVRSSDGVREKLVLGAGAPISLVADASMADVTIAPGSRYVRALPADHSLAAVAVSGRGRWIQDWNGLEVPINAGDFSVIHTTQPTNLLVRSEQDGLRLVLIEVPTNVRYPLYSR